MDFLPLKFPCQWPDLCRRSLLVGFPVIGSQVGAYHDLCAHLNQRTPECWALWGPDPERIRAAQFVAETLADAVEWPNLILHPEDPFELLFWDHKSCAIDDLSLVEAMMTIEDHFNVSSTVEELNVFQKAPVSRYLDFLLGRPG